MKKYVKKLTVKKIIIANLNSDEIEQVRAASLIAACSVSCSALAMCCITTQAYEYVDNYNND